MAERPGGAAATPGSLSRRLLLAALVWMVLALAGAGVLLTGLFREHIERRFDVQLTDHLDELVAATEIDADGAPTLVWQPADPRFALPLSGWYWQIDAAGETLAASGSLAGEHLVVPAGDSHVVTTLALRAPDGQALRARAQSIAFPGARSALRFVIAGPISDVERDVAGFSRSLVLTLLALGATLALAAVLQVRFGLRPLTRLGRALEDVRRGAAPRLAGDWPAEVAPLAAEINALLDAHATRLARARTEAGNLAHALKTPISVLRNELASIGGERGRLLREQLALVSDRLERHLSRTRAAGSAEVTGTSTPVAAVVDDIHFGVSRLHAGRGLRFDVDVEPTTLVFRGDAEDLGEMLGNLVDNACKWAQGQVRLRATHDDGALVVRVEDDGAGIPAEERERVLRRGRRLDESVPGSGLGLAITDELAGLYGGQLRLADSELGGLLVELRLPGAALR